MSFTKVIRASIAIILLIVLAIIFRYFMTRTRGKIQVSQKPEKISLQKIEEKEQIVHYEFKKGDESFQVRADKHYVGKDDRNHLEGNVVLILKKKEEGKDVFLYGNEIVYDKDWNHFFLSGKAKARFKDVEIESSLFHYDKKQELFESENGVGFSSKKLWGSAKKLKYLMEKEIIELQEDVHLRLKPSLETTLPIEVKGGMFEYSRNEMFGKMEGDVQLFQGENHGLADLLRFKLYPDGENFKTVFLKGIKKNVRATLVSEGKEALSAEQGSSPFAQSVRREIEAEEIELSAFPDAQKIREVKTKGNCSFKFISSEGSFIRFQAQRITLILNTVGELKEFHALENARMDDQEEESEEKRVVVGDSLIMEDNTDILQVSGKKPYEARISSTDTEVMAKELLLSFDNNNLEARGGVKAVLKSQEKGMESIGFFSNEKPVFVTAQEMRYLEANKRFIFNGSVKIWQEKETLYADDVVLHEETGQIQCKGGVRSVFPLKPKEGKEEEKVELSARRMKFESEENILFYEEESSFKVKDIRLRAKTISVYLKEKRGEMERMIAQGGVVIFKGLSEGRGYEAIYDPEEETIVLTGSPELIDEDRGVTKGDKLTFYIADGRIEVKGKRSVTVIK